MLQYFINLLNKKKKKSMLQYFNENKDQCYNILLTFLVKTKINVTIF